MADSGSSLPARIDFVTLGMFIIDDIYPPPAAPSQLPNLNVVGGAGTYSALGARLFSPPPLSQTVGWIIDAGLDFPPPVRDLITSWQTGALVRPRNAPTTRGWNGYTANDHREFKYLTEKLRITAADLTPDLLDARSIHLICSASRCVEMVQQIHHRRDSRSSPQQDSESPPILIWEPVPDLCLPSELPATLQALEYVGVISPNHEELGSLFSFTHPADNVDKAAVEAQAQRLLSHHAPTNSKYRSGPLAVVVRVGKEGCYVATPTLQHWLPAYHTSSAKVIDPTGGGNAFLGGLAVGLVRNAGDVVEAARYGSIAASFAIEQVGVPVLARGGVSEVELWNRESVMLRLEEFGTRTME
ncbi:hypothetical protein LTR08_000159 [Meristemomyces frigidus]|nr:hypothetical protein LTR08_000159 [Meristemomyces frigidus]